MDLNFRLFNCDRTFNLDKVEALITTVAKKLSRTVKVEQRYFPLPRMADLCNELNEGGKLLGYAVFVVHAHESRLSLNEENAGIGYAKLYRTLLNVTDDRVLIVIGGDDNYKPNERDELFLTKWAWWKICSQFTEDYMNGIKSFIFSWDENHAPIHEEALEFYLNPTKSGQKFVPRPRPKPPKIQPSNLDTSQSKGQTRAASLPILEKRHGIQGQPTHTTSLPTNAKEQKRDLDQQFQPEKTQSRLLPTIPPTSQTGSILPSEKSPNLMDQQDPQTSKVIQTRLFPMVQVLSILSDKDHILQNPVLSLLGEVFESLRIPSGPYVPDIRAERLSYHVKTTKPDCVVLVNEYEDIKDLENLPRKTQLFTELFGAVRESEGTKMYFVVTGSTDYKEGDLSSKLVEEKVKNLNNGILKHDRLTILSWNNNPCPLHRDALIQLLNSHLGRNRQSESSTSNTEPEYHPQKGRLRYRALIQDGRVVAVLKCDPYDWRPEDTKLRPILDRHRERTEFELWEDNRGSVTIAVLPMAITLRKMAEAAATESRHSLQVYSYHSNEESFKIIDDFLKGLGIHFTPHKTPLQVQTVLQHIKEKKPGFVVFSTDMNVFGDFATVQKQIRDHWMLVRDNIAKLQGIIIILIGDNECPEGHLVSTRVTDYVQRLTTEFPLNTEKLTVMSWNKRPYIIHQDEMKRLLMRIRPLQTTSQESVSHKKQQEVVPNPPLPKGLEFDRVKGYLRFRADLKYGSITEVRECIPPGWWPDRADIEFLQNRYRNEPKALLEFWADSFDGPAKPPVVTTKGTGSWLKMPSLPSWKSSSYDQKDDYV